MPRETYKQTFDQPCGAVSLMVAAKELGITHLPVNEPRYVDTGIYVVVRRGGV